MVSAIAPTPRRISVLGATGSVGQSTLDVLRQSRDAFTIEALVANGNLDELVAAALEFRPQIAVLADDAKRDALADALRGTGIAHAAGRDAVLDAASRPADWTMAAIAGTAGLEPTLAAVKRGGTIALANKECLVCAGHAFMDEARKSGACILPVDSEHNALFQALGGGDVRDAVKMTLTASGGPFRGWSRDALNRVRPEQALKHPTWTMGRKITIDSASLMNKGLELIEARHLFGIEPDKLDVLVHPQSIVHGLVQWRDGSVVAGLAPADMRIPISHCLGYPARRQGCSPCLDLAQIGALTFERVDDRAFPAVQLAFAAMRQAGGSTAYNAANEEAVAAFLSEKIGFNAIAGCVEHVMDELLARAELYEPETAASALELHALARRTAAAFVEQHYERLSV
jgi:1-deoxy-D-xylulose-5-phosphate reductoisomerase